MRLSNIYTIKSIAASIFVNVCKVCVKSKSLSVCLFIYIFTLLHYYYIISYVRALSDTKNKKEIISLYKHTKKNLCKSVFLCKSGILLPINLYKKFTRIYTQALDNCIVCKKSINNIKRDYHV